MTSWAPDQRLVDAARRELQLREDVLPKRVASDLMDREDASVDWQAWHCILGFIETGQFQSIDAGGANGTTIVSWPEAIAAAAKAADAVQKLAADASGDKRERLQQRHASLVAIHRSVQLRGGSIAWINQQLRRRHGPKAKAAA